MVSSRFITNHKTTKKHLKKNGFVFGRGRDCSKQEINLSDFKENSNK